MSTIVVTCSTGQGPAIGGSGLTGRRIARGLQSRGHRVHWVGLGPDPKHPQDIGLIYHQVEPVNKEGLWDHPVHFYPLVEKLMAICLTEKVDVLHAHYLYPWGYAVLEVSQALASLGIRVPVVLRPAGTDIWELGRQMPTLTRSLLTRADHIIVNTQGFLTDLLGVIRLSGMADPELPISLIPNPIPEVFRRGDYTFHEEARIPDGAVVVGLVGNFRPKQRAPLAVEIFAQASAGTQALLLLVGEGPELDAALQRARELGILDRVRRVGVQYNMPPVFSAMDILLHPSRQDSFGNAVGEAQACGVPVVATKIGGLPEVVAEGETGFLCDPNAQDWYVAVLRRLILETELRQRMGQAAAERIHCLFDAEKIVAEYERILLSVV